MGFVAYHVPVKSMKLTPEMMIDVAAELLRQNDWSEGTRFQDLSWLDLKYQHKSYYQLRLHYRPLMHWIYAKCR
jgi:hypothetical protein